MKDLQSVEFKDIDFELLYIVVIEAYEDRDDPTELKVVRGTGAEVIDLLKNRFPHDEDEPKESLEKFIERAESFNGDGWDFVQIYEL